MSYTDTKFHSSLTQNQKAQTLFFKIIQEIISKCVILIT